jgi:hypothetical protein
MKAVLQTAVLVLGVSLAAAQAPVERIASTNSGALPADDELTLSLPRIGVELYSPQTQSIRPGVSIDDDLVAELFQEATNVAAGSSAVETGEQVIAVPLDSLELRHETEVASAGGMSVSGPLVRLFNGAKPGELPKRFLQLVNPLAPMEASPITPQVPNEHRRAWASLVGWNPGVSAFPEPRTHVPSLDLFSMSTSP